MKNISINLVVAGLCLISANAVAGGTDEQADCSISMGTGDCSQPIDVTECFQTLDGDRKYILKQDLDCSCGESPALQLLGKAKLDLNGKTLSCSACDDPDAGILVQGDEAVVENGEVNRCERGILVEDGKNHRFENLTLSENRRSGLRARSDSSDSQFVNIRAYDNIRRGLRIEGSNNKVHNNVAFGNGRQGIIIEGDSNEVKYNTANHNCRDGIEIDAGNENVLMNNIADGNGNPYACQPVDEEDRDNYLFGIDWRPWFYAGIDITAKDQPSGNDILHNAATDNLGCWVSPQERVEPDSTTWMKCIDSDSVPESVEDAVAALRNRNLWDENADESDKCISTNEWAENRSDDERDAQPECPKP